MWEINGLPLHVLVVHAAVVFGPVSALLALAYVAWPSWRDRLRWLTVGVAVLTAVIMWAANLTGGNFLDSDRFAHVSGHAAELIHDHEEYGDVLPWVTTAFALVTVVAGWLHTRTGGVRVLLRVLVAAGAVATLVYVFLTGEAGARAVWGS